MKPLGITIGLVQLLFCPLLFFGIYLITIRGTVMKTLLLTLLLTAAAHAQTTYTYLGAPMQGNGTATTLNFTQLTGTVTLAQPLNPNQANQVVTPISYIFNNTLQAPTTGSFTFTTQNGLITAWNIIANSSNPPLEMDMSITDQGDTYFYALWTTDCQPSYPNCTHWSATNSAPGAWSVDMATAQATAFRLWQMDVENDNFYAEQKYTSQVIANLKAQLASKH